MERNSYRLDELVAECCCMCEWAFTYIAFNLLLIYHSHRNLWSYFRDDNRSMDGD